MAELKIKGSKKYIEYLSSHLKEEHPKTKKYGVKMKLNKW